MNSFQSENNSRGKHQKNPGRQRAQFSKSLLSHQDTRFSNRNTQLGGKKVGFIMIDCLREQKRTLGKCGKVNERMMD